MVCVDLERGSLSTNAPGRWILEAKIHSYKLYSQSFLSLLMERGWVSDEVSIGAITLLIAIPYHINSKLSNHNFLNNSYI